MLQLIHKYDFAKYVMQNKSLCPIGNIALRWLPLNLAMKIIFGVGNSLLTPINTPLPEPRLTPINVTILHLNATLSLLVAYSYHTPVSVRKSSAMKYTITVCVLWYIGAERKWPLFCRRYFKFLSMNEICCILMRISPKFVPWSPIANRSVLVEITAWRLSGD